MKKNIIIIFMLLLVQQIYSKSDTPDYGTVFNQTELLEINITIDKKNWDAMNKDLNDNLPESNGHMGGRPGGVPPMGGRPEGRPPMGGMPGELPPPDITSLTTFDPIWVEAEISFNNETWEHVGIRYKGNSSLKSGKAEGNSKLSFKLDFDQFEDEYPAIKNQRFYGFKQLNLNNNFNDSSQVREKVASDLFREFGLVSAQTAFCIVNVDYGEGIKTFGSYTIVEEMDDTVVKTQLGDDSGNLYKPEGDSATFAKDTFNAVEMDKKNNKNEDDYSDVEVLNSIINSPLRTSDTNKWKSDLEDEFNVDGFLKWLAANSVLQNWDTYGKMSHNYYLYNNPATGQLNWIPWDNNEALQAGKRGESSISLREIDENWPLIRYILDDQKYKNIYDNYIQEFTTDIFTPDRMDTIYNNYYMLLNEYSSVIAIEELKNHVIARNIAVHTYLKN